MRIDESPQGRPHRVVKNLCALLFELLPNGVKMSKEKNGMKKFF